MSIAGKNREMRENMENERNNRNESESRERGSRGRGRGAMNGPSRGGGRGRGRGGFRGNRFDRERERGPQIDTWTNETAENAEKENSSSSKDCRYCDVGVICVLNRITQICHHVYCA